MFVAAVLFGTVLLDLAQPASSAFAAGLADPAPGSGSNGVSTAGVFATGADVMVVGTGEVGLKLRSGPGPSYPVAVTADEGTVLRVVAGPVSDGDGNWYQVNANTNSGRLRGWAPGTNLVDPALVKPQPDGAVGTRSFTAKTMGYASGNGIGFYTATGTRVHWGTVAVDPKFIPLGSLMLIQGLEGVFVAEDTGSGVRDAMVDVWFPDLAAALRFGTQNRAIIIIREGYGS
ncbi:MAG: SH3 domain-containing protein [Chloroflexi bacterium]|nr:SH3 domain-containing protein [Chloroflexota bacterium]